MIETDVEVGDFNLKDKTDFELCREFTLWDPHTDAALLKQICIELRRRHQQLPLMKFTLVALMNNCLLLLLEAVYRDRWEYFEDGPADVLKQLLVSITIFFLPAFFIGLLSYLKNDSLTVLIIGSLWILLFIVPGIIETRNDIKRLNRIDRLLTGL